MTFSEFWFATREGSTKCESSPQFRCLGNRFLNCLVANPVFSIWHGHWHICLKILQISMYILHGVIIDNVRTFDDLGTGSGNHIVHMLFPAASLKTNELSTKFSKCWYIGRNGHWSCENWPHCWSPGSRFRNRLLSHSDFSICHGQWCICAIKSANFDISINDNVGFNYILVVLESGPGSGTTKWIISFPDANWKLMSCLWNSSNFAVPPGKVIQNARIGHIVRVPRTGSRTTKWQILPLTSDMAHCWIL